MNALLDPRLAQCDVLQLTRLLLRPPAALARPPAIDEVLRFRADIEAGFPMRNVSDIRLGASGGAGSVAQITTPDFCVGSVLGPLPQAYLEWMRDQVREGHGATRDFLDLFNHRMNVLRFRVRAELDLALNNQVPERTLLAHWIASLMGLGQPHAASQVPLRMRQWLGMGEWLANIRRSAAGVERVLSTCLGCPVRLTPFTPHWRALGKSNEHRLGQRRLGESAYLGQCYWDVRAAVTLDIGPLHYDTLLALLPPLRDTSSAEPDASNEGALSARQMLQRWIAQADGPGAMNHHTLHTLVRLLTERRHDAWINLQVRAREVPPSYLHAQAGDATAPGLRLGQTAWLKSRNRHGVLHRGGRLQLNVARYFMATERSQEWL